MQLDVKVRKQVNVNILLDMKGSTENKQWLKEQQCKLSAQDLKAQLAELTGLKVWREP